MEFLIALGTGIVEKIVDYTFEPVARQVVYLFRRRSNLKILHDGVEKLKAERQSVANEVVAAERRGEQVQPNVQLWLQRVDDITARSDEFFNHETQANLQCLGGLCPNVKVRHQLSRDSTKLLPEVVQLDQNKGFSAVSCGVCRQEVVGVSTGDYQAFESRTSAVNKIMDELKKSDTKRIGVYGIGGVGKTTLIQQVYNQVKKHEESKLFDDVVILLDVKSNPDPEAVQKQIVEQLGMAIIGNETKGGRASRLCARIRDKKVLVILDDVWEEINLEALGIPDVAAYKILLTSRTRKVLSDMGTQPDFMLDILEEEESWVLFEKKARDIVKDPVIRPTATQIATYCRGLPILVVTLASTLKKKTSLPLWKDALRCLQESSSEESTEKAYSGLEWSYHQLNDNTSKQLFLLCGHIIKGNTIVLTDLLNYSMGLGFFGKTCTVEKARNALLTYVEKLKDFCLLIDNDDNIDVRMHDLLRDTANRIAFRDPHILSSVVDELKEWPDNDVLEKCTTIALLGGNKIPTLPEVMQCPALKMLALKPDDDSLKIPPRFFEEMKQLCVLGLASLDIPALPSSFQSLKNVQMLCLEECKLEDITLVGELSTLTLLSFSGSRLKKLPKEIAKLVHLRLLDLSNCSECQGIPFGVISSLTSLEELKMNKFDKWEADGEGSNASIMELKRLPNLAALEIRIPEGKILPENLFSSCMLERYRINIGYDPWSSGDHCTTALKGLTVMDTIQLDKCLKMLLKNTECLKLGCIFGIKNTPDHHLDAHDFQQVQHLILRDNVDFTYIINRKVVFPNLTTLKVMGCYGLRFLFSCSMARSLVKLKHLEIDSGDRMEEIVSSTREDKGYNMDAMFPKLECLILIGLPELVRFCTSRYIEFPALEKLIIKHCYELRSFICHPSSSEERDTAEMEILDTELGSSLFDEKVGFRSLESLEIENSGIGWKTIWHIQLAHQDSFCMLKYVRVASRYGLKKIFTSAILGRLNALKTIELTSCSSVEVVFEAEGNKEINSGPTPFYLHNLDSIAIYHCYSLRSIFPVAVARGLETLHTLTVHQCFMLETIVAEEEGAVELDTTAAHFVFEFPKVTNLSITRAPGLKFYPGMHTSKWPSLKKLEMGAVRIGSFYGGDCTDLYLQMTQLFASQVSFFRRKREQAPETDQPLFLIDKDSFPELESLSLELAGMEIWYGDGPPSADFFPKLKTLEFQSRSPLSKQAGLVFLEKLQSLERIELYDLVYGEILFEEGRNSSGERHADAAGTLPHLKYMKISTMLDLLHDLHLGSQANSQSAAARQLIPNLQVLDIEYCRRLRNLESSAISFRNLTTLNVVSCLELKYLISFSVAKILVQLTTLKVADCGEIEVIIATEEGDAADENISLSFTLQNLELSRLRRLQGFFPRHCVVKFPSLETYNVEDCNRYKISPNADGVLQLAQMEAVEEEGQQVSFKLE